MPRRWYLLPCRTFQPVVVVTQSLPNGTQGTAYSFQFSANGGTLPYTWSLQSDTGSNTWTISSSGLLTGTPGNAETDTITAQVTDAVGGVALSAPLSLVVSAASTIVFDHFISTTGSNGNVGDLAHPWALSAITVHAGIYTNLGALPGVYNVAALGTVGAGTGAFNIPVINIPGGTVAAPVIVGSCDTNGNYSPAGLGAVGTWAILDGGQTDTAKRTNDATTTSTVLSDSTASMTPGQFADGLHYLVFNCYNGNDGYFSSLIVANTPTTITVNTAITEMSQGVVSTISGTTINAPNGYVKNASGNQSAVVFTTTGTMPTGLTAGQTYYVVGTPTGTGFSVAATTGGAAITPGTTWTGTLTVSAAGCYFISNNPNSSPMIGTQGTAATNSHVTIAGFEMQHCTGRTVDMRMPSSVLSNPRITGIFVKDCYIHDQSTAFGYGDNTTAITFTAVDGTNGGTTNNASGCINNTITKIFVTDGSGRSDAIEYWGCQGCVTKNNTLVGTAQFATPNSNITGMTTGDIGSANGACINYKNAQNSNLSIIGNYIDAHLTGPSGGSGGAMDYNNTGPYSPNTDVHAFNLVNAGNGFIKQVIGVSLPFAEHEQYYNNTFIDFSGASAPTGIQRYTKTATQTVYNNIYVTSGSWYTYGAGSFDADAPVICDYEMFSGPGAYKRTLGTPGTAGAGLVTYTAPNGTVNPGSTSGFAAACTSATSPPDAHSIVTAAAPGFINTGVLSAKYQLTAGSPFKNMGSTNGQSSGLATDPGCFGNGNTQVGSTYAAALGLT